MKTVIKTRKTFTIANRALFDGRGDVTRQIEESFLNVLGGKKKNELLLSIAEEMVEKGYYAQPPGYIHGKPQLLTSVKRGIVSHLARSWRKKQREEGKLKCGNIDAWRKFCNAHKWDPVGVRFTG